MSNTQTVDVTATPVDTSAQAPQSNVTEVSPFQLRFDPSAPIKRLMNLSESDALKRIDELKNNECFEIITLFHSDAARDAIKSKLSDAVYKRLVSTVCHKVQTISAEFNDADRWQKDILDNTGLYIQRTPMGSLGVEIGAHHHSEKDGRKTVSRAGAGFYLRHTQYETLSVPAEKQEQLAAELAAALA
jgi:hypothetical protein